MFLPFRTRRVLAPFALLLLVAAGCGERPLAVHAVFDDVRGLEVGDAVEVSGVRVGSVKALEVRDDGRVDVRVEIDPEHRGHVTEDAALEFVGGGWLAPRRSLALVPGDGPPAGPGAELEAREGLALEGRVRDFVREIRRTVDDPEVRARIEELERSARELAEKGRETWERQRPELERQVEEILREAERESDELARRIEEEWKKLREAWEEELRRGTDDSI